MIRPSVTHGIRNKLKEQHNTSTALADSSTSDHKEEMKESDQPVTTSEALGACEIGIYHIGCQAGQLLAGKQK
jgi:hypothetical protein